MNSDDPKPAEGSPNLNPTGPADSPLAAAESSSAAHGESATPAAQDAPNPALVLNETPAGASASVEPLAQPMEASSVPASDAPAIPAEAASPAAAAETPATTAVAESAGNTPADAAPASEPAVIAADAVIAPATSVAAAAPGIAKAAGPVVYGSVAKNETGGEARRGLNIPLAVAALALVAIAAGLFFKDIEKLRHEKSGIAAANVIAEEKRKEISDTANGWYPAPRDPIFSWDQDAQGWQIESETPAPILASLADNKAVPPAAVNPAVKTLVDALQIAAARDDATRGKAMQIPVHFPDPATVLRQAVTGPDDPYKLVGIRCISYDVYLPKACPGFVGCLFFLKDKDGLWFQARTRAALVPGEWTTVTADIRGDSPDVTPLGHLGQWDDNQATKVRMIGITFYGDKKWDGEVQVDNFRGWMRPQRFAAMVSGLTGGAGPQPIAAARIVQLTDMVKKAESFKEETVQVINLRTEPAGASDGNGPSSPPMVRKFETLTLRFELNRQIDNPFDPEKADVTCIVESKSGKKTEHIGFWFQDYDRVDRFAEEELKPMGRPEWRVRITPREEGEFTYKLRVKLKNEPMLELPARQFFCMPSEVKGFINVSKKDPRFFEFENGDFYYPIGHNLSSPVDIRCWKIVFNQDPPAGRGLPMYMDYFDKMEKNGENMAEVWMASWWLGIEWTSRWRDYYGAGRYSLQHAWKLDALLELAHKHGIYIHLVLDNHGKFSNWCDWEFENNPYNRNSAGDNGVVNNSEEFFTDPSCRKMHRNKLRYIAARWGSDPTIFGWELCSEFDLVGGTSQVATRGNHPRVYFHRSPVLKTWAREMIGSLRQSDCYGHPITNHYATDYKWIDVDLARESGGVGMPLFDYVATDVYRPPEKRFMVSAVENQQWFNANLRAEAKKPFWITEYGGDFNAAPVDFLNADVHCGMWSTWMTEGAGTPLFWWYDLIDTQNLYPYYKAFSAFTKGEDRRGLNGISAPLTVSGTSGAVLGYAYRWPNGAYGWVYNDAAMRTMPPAGERPHHEGVETVIPELSAGKYMVEYWDCYSGTVVKSDAVEVKAGHSLRLAFPPFVNDMAVKVKRTDAPAAAEGRKPDAEPAALPSAAPKRIK